MRLKLVLNVLHLLPNWLEITVDVHKEFQSSSTALLKLPESPEMLWLLFYLPAERVQTQPK